MGVGRIPEKGTLKTARVKMQTDVNGDASVLLKVPGTTGQKTRLIEGGTGWFDNPHADDFVKISIIDQDNMLGAGAGSEVGGYYDNEVPADNQGWYIPHHAKQIEMMAITDMAHLVAGLYLKIEVKKGDGSQDYFRANVKWGTID